MFLNKSVFPLSQSMKMVDSCDICGYVVKDKSNSAPGMNYALTVVAYVIVVILYALIFGITYKDNSFIYCFFTSTAIVILIQPWLIRFSKILYLHVLEKM